MVLPLMPKATAIWLIENTSLTFEQIAEFCGLHPLEVQSIADGDVAKGIIGIDPITSGQLSLSEIERCSKDPKARLMMNEEFKRFIIAENKKKKVGKYTPVARRSDKPDAIAWLLKNCPELSETQISKLIGTTKSTILSIKNKSHWNFSNIKTRDPVLLGLCTQTELDKVYSIAKKRAESIELAKKSQIESEISEKVTE
jgi:hypothetical protein